MRSIVLSTGTELLLGDVRDAHLSFIAQQILALGLRIDEERIVPDGTAIRDALSHVMSRADLVFVTGGLGPTSDDITRELAAELLGLELDLDEKLLDKIMTRLKRRGIRATDRISRQAYVPRGARVLPNENGTAPGFYLAPNINPAIPTPHLFILPGPPRELQPMFRQFVLPILQEIAKPSVVRKLYKIANMGESIVEEAIGERVLAVRGVELGYCARPGEVDVRIMGEPAALEQADAIIMATLGRVIFSTNDESLEEVIVHLLAERKETLALAESCTGGLLANRITNVSGASDVFLAGYVTYSNDAKTDISSVDPKLIESHGAVSEEVARAMAEGARQRAGSTHALSTTGIAGPTGGSAEKPVGTAFIALASEAAKTVVKKFFFPTDRETFKQIVFEVAFDLLRRRILRDDTRVSS